MGKSKERINLLFALILFYLFQANVSGQFFATLSAVSEPDICQGDSVAASVLFIGGRSPYTIVINNSEGKFLEVKDLESNEVFYLEPTVSDRYYLASAKDKKRKKGSVFGSINVEIHEATPVAIDLERTVFLESEPGYTLRSSPAGGLFSGPGVSNNAFYPAEATATKSPHLITCSYENPNGCVTRDKLNLFVLSGQSRVDLYSGDEVITTVCDKESLYILRGSNEDGLAGTFELFGQGSSDPLPGHITDENSEDNQAVLSPNGLAGSYEVVYTYGMESVEVKASATFTVYETGLIGILNLPDTICKNGPDYQLLPEVSVFDPEASYEFYGPGVSGNQADGYFFDPGAPDVLPGLNEIVLTYTAHNGCRVNERVMAYLGAIPSLDFTPDLICLGLEGGMVSFSNLSSPKESIANWSWDFGDPASGGANFSSLENPEHYYSEPGTVNIKLSAYTHEGCFASHTKDTLLVGMPGVEFSWASNCYTDMQGVSFKGFPQSKFSSLKSLSWIFTNIEGEVLDVIIQEPAEGSLDYAFPGLGTYHVTFIAQDEAGCQGELTKQITLTPVEAFSEDGYLETFENILGGWRAGSENQLNSWTLGSPDFKGFSQDENDLAWYTDLPHVAEGYLEHSWVSSPCFDLSGLERPVVQLDVMKSFTPGKDGAVLQYKDPESGAWLALGKVGGGLNWYTDSSIVNRPGGDGIGWGLSFFEPDSKWVKASYSMGGLSADPFMQLRLAIASEGSREIIPGQYNQGFAFDNFSIGEARLKRSVLEYFTNSSNGYIQDADELVSDLAARHADVVYDLHYHMNVPEEDPMHDNNPLAPSTRAFNYGVPLVPYAVLNGGANPEQRYNLSPPSDEIDEETLVRTSFEAPLFELFLSVDYQENKLEGTATILCVDDGFDSYLQIYLVVIEKEVTSYPWLRQGAAFRNVVLDIIPTPAGKLLGNSWTSGKVSEFDFSWAYTQYVEDIEDLSVIAFIQDRESGSILQATDMARTPGVNLPVNELSYESMVLFPNPAETSTTLKFGSRVEEQSQLVLVDISGQEVERIFIKPGTLIQELDLTQLPRGIFVVLWKEAGVVKGQAKLIHQ